MPYSTPIHQLPAPAGGDLVSSGDDTLRQLVDKLDALLVKRPEQAAGQFTVNQLTTTTATVNVSFPAGRFTSPPAVNLTPNTNSPEVAQASAWNVTASGFEAKVRRTTGSINTVFYWNAIAI